MNQNFIEFDREQAFLMPPSLRDWLPQDHLAWSIIDAVAELDLEAFYRSYRPDGHGRAAYEPSMMVTLVLFAYATKVRSSRGIERHCRQDIAYRVITGNLIPDHATIARFVVRHETALAELFSQVLGLCAKAGLVNVGVIAVDGTRVAANASPEANRDYAQIAQEIVAEGKATDQAEDKRYGEARGDELPEQLHTSEGRRAAFAQAKRQLDTDAAEQEQTPAGKQTPADAQTPAGKQTPADAQTPAGEPTPADEGSGSECGREFEFDAERIVARVQGREGWPREAKRQLDQQRWRDAEPVRRSRHGRLEQSKRRLEDDLDAERAGNEAYEAYRAGGVMKDGRRFGKPPKPYTPPETPEGKVNVTDPDSKQVKTNAGFGWVQGYNAQAVVTADQIVLAAEITNNTADFSQLRPMVQATVTELSKAGMSERPQIAMADAGYWNEEHFDDVIADEHIQVLVPPDAGNRTTPRPGWTGGRYTWMRYVLHSDAGERIYRRRKAMIEPVFGHTKHNRGVRHFHRRGRTAVRTEWRLLMMTHNLAKLHRHQIATAGP